MLGGKRMFRLVFNRRVAHKPVVTERRVKRIRHCEAEAQLRAAIQRLSDAISKSTGDHGSNTVKFVTFAEVCSYRAPNLNVRLCRNPKHKQAGGLAECNEELCPFMRAV